MQLPGSGKGIPYQLISLYNNKKGVVFSLSMTLFLYICTRNKTLLLMKKILFLLLLSLSTVAAHAQYLNITKINDRTALSIDMNAESEGFSNVELCIFAENIQKFIKSLQKIRDRAEKLAPSLDNHIDYGRPVPGSISVDYLVFQHGNERTYSRKNFVVPALYIDNENYKYLILRGYYQGKTDNNKTYKFNYSILIPFEFLNDWISQIGQKDLDIRFDRY